MTYNSPNIQLRPTKIEDLDTLFRFQLDQEAGYLAAFMPKDPSDKVAYLEKHTRLLSDPTVHNQTILVDNVIVKLLYTFNDDPNFFIKPQRQDL